MTKYFVNNFAITNLHKKPSDKSEVMTQMIYGDCFSVAKKNRNWIKVKIKDDGYSGFVKKKNFARFYKPTHKICVLKANVYRSSNKKGKLIEIPFGSKIKVTDRKKNYFKFSNGWIAKKDIKSVSFKEKNLQKSKIFKLIQIWGGENKINLIWYVSHSNYSEGEIFSFITKKRINFAFKTKDSALKDILKSGLKNSQGGDSDIGYMSLL